MKIRLRVPMQDLTKSHDHPVTVIPWPHFCRPKDDLFNLTRHEPQTPKPDPVRLPLLSDLSKYKLQSLTLSAAPFRCSFPLLPFCCSLSAAPGSGEWGGSVKITSDKGGCPICPQKGWGLKVSVGIEALAQAGLSGKAEAKLEWDLRDKFTWSAIDKSAEVDLTVRFAKPEAYIKIFGGAKGFYSNNF